MRTWKDVATLVKTKGLNGRFVARNTTDLPLLIPEGTLVAFVPPQLDVPRQARVTFVQPLQDDTFQVGFDSVEDEECAHQLVGCHCLVPADELPDSQEHEVDTLLGYSMQQGDEVIGTVADVLENPAHPLLSVIRPSGEEVLVPVVDEFIENIDDDAQVIYVQLPSGLLSL